MNYDLPDHPVIQNMERTGYPDGKEPTFPICPVCGEECEEIFRDKDLNIVGCDICIKQGKPYVYGAICGFEGQVSVFNYGNRKKSYRDLYPDEEEMKRMSPPSKGVMGITPAVVGSIEATEVLKIICGFGDVLAGELWTIDLRTLQSNKFSL